MTRAPKSLADIRRQAANRRKSIASVTNNSAFHALEKKNEKFTYGRAIPRRDPDKLPPPASKVTRRLPTKKLTQRPRPATEPVEKGKAVECWRVAGGDSFALWEEAPASPTRIVGLARLPTWALEAFKAGVKQVAEKNGEVQDLVVQEVKDGAEDCADVYAMFRSELVAEIVKEGLEGKMVEGKMLQVRYSAA